MKAKDGNKDTWTTQDQFPDLGKIHFRPLSQSDRVFIGGRFGHRLLRLNIATGSLYFEHENMRRSNDKHTIDHICMLAFLTLILILCYLAIRRILRPLRWISAGVSEVRHGNLNHRVRIRGNDELTDLAVSFNEMTAELRAMIEKKEHLLRDVSHELRSPLTRMRVAVEMLEDKDMKSELLQDLEAMEKMVATILETARENHLSRDMQISKVDLEPLLKSVTANYQGTPPGLRYHSTGKPQICMADYKALVTVFTNLIENGLKYSDENDNPVEIVIATRKEFIEVIIKDSGCGIADSELPYIFEPFYRVDRSRSKKSGGFGLGLSLCKTIIEALGGKIKAASNPGRGTSVTVTLPYGG